MRSVKAQDVSGAIRIAIAGVLVFSVVAILVSPDPSDDVDGVFHQHHLRLLHPFFVATSLLRDLLVARQMATASVNPSKREMADLLDLVCSRLC